MNRVISIVFLVLLLSSCSYLETLQRVNEHNENLNSDKKYDEKCLISEACIVLYGEVDVSLLKEYEYFTIAVVLEDGNERVIDFEYGLKRVKKEGQLLDKIIYGFYLPSGNYRIYVFDSKQDLKQVTPQNFSGRSTLISISDQQINNGIATLNRHKD